MSFSLPCFDYSSETHACHKIVAMLSTPVFEANFEFWNLFNNIIDALYQSFMFLGKIFFATKDEFIYQEVS